MNASIKWGLSRGVGMAVFGNLHRSHFRSSFSPWAVSSSFHLYYPCPHPQGILPAIRISTHKDGLNKAFLHLKVSSWTWLFRRKYLYRHELFLWNHQYQQSRSLSISLSLSAAFSPSHTHPTHAYTFMDDWHTWLPNIKPWSRNPILIIEFPVLSVKPDT